MERIYLELIIHMSIFIIVLSFLTTLVFWVISIKDRKKLEETDTFEEFKENMNIRVLKKLIRLDKTNAEIINDMILHFENNKKRLTKLGRLIQFYLYFSYILVFIGFFLTIFRYYVFLKTDYVFPVRFPLAELLTLIILSVVLNISFWTKIGANRINLIYQKLNELKHHDLDNISS